ncbi:MAG: hypothetical protein ACOYOU_16320 [Kiritimatiellia bacterium]
MGWIFNTWTSWIDNGGRTWKVLVAAGVLTGSGLLYWYERPEPNYPRPQDEAVVLAATCEREMIRGTLDTNAAPILTLRTLAGTSNAVTNAVMYYPSGYNPYGALVSDGWEPTHGTLAVCAFHALYSLQREAWVDMRPGQPWVHDLTGFADNQVSWGDFFSHLVAPVWWTNFYDGVWFTGYDDAQPWMFKTNAPPYIATKPYHEIAKMLSVMRADVRHATLINYTTYTKRGVALDQPSWELASAVALQNLMLSAVETNHYSHANGPDAWEFVYTWNWYDYYPLEPTNYHRIVEETVTEFVWGYQVHCRTNGLDRVWLTVQGRPYWEWWEPTLTLVEGVPTMMWSGTMADMGVTNWNGHAYHTYTRPAPAWDWDIPAATNAGDWAMGWGPDMSDVPELADEGGVFTTLYDFQFLTNAAPFWGGI